MQSQINDPTCVGPRKGWSSRCSKCPGGPFTEKENLVTVYIEPGMKDGETIRFSESGTQSLTADPGDLVIHLRLEKEEELYVRHENDLHTQIFVTLPESLVGFTMSLPHPSGVPVALSRSTITVDNETIKVVGKGMPITGSGNFGDLFVKVRVRYPAQELDNNAKNSIREIFKKTTKWTHIMPN